MSSAICFNLDQSKILSSGNGLAATFQFSSAASLNLGRAQNHVFGNGFRSLQIQLHRNKVWQQEMSHVERGLNASAQKNFWPKSGFTVYPRLKFVQLATSPDVGSQVSLMYELFTKWQFFRQDQIQNKCRQQIQNCKNDDFCLWQGGKPYGKRRKCWLPAFSLFPTRFSEDVFLRVFKSQHYVVNNKAGY